MSPAISAENKAVVLLKDFVTHYDKNGDGKVDETEKLEAEDIAKSLDTISPDTSESVRINNYVSTADFSTGQKLSEELRDALALSRDHAVANGAERFAATVSRFLEITAQPATEAMAAAPTAAQNLAAVIKANISGLTSESINGLMRGHYRQLRLMDESGNWNSPELANIGDALLPHNLELSDLEALVDRIAVNADENPYLHDLLEMAEAKGFDALSAKVQEQGPEVFASVVTYAYAQNQLTRAMREDWHVIEACEFQWAAARKAENIWKEMDAFEKFKFLGVKSPIDSFVKHHKKGKVPKNFLSLLLPLNIVMANMADKKKGFDDNVKAGAALAKHAPGGRDNPATGSGPASWSDDGKAIDLRIDNVGQWDDLYEVWNLAFVSDYKHFPFVMVKLMTDQVSDYQNAPEEFMYNRALALYTHMHFAMFGRIDGALATEERVQWGSDELTRFMGEVAAQSAEDYELSVKAAEASRKKDILDATFEAMKR